MPVVPVDIGNACGSEGEVSPGAEVTSAVSLWDHRDLECAEENDDLTTFDRFLRHHMRALQRFLINRGKRIERGFPRFYEHLQRRVSHSPSFGALWNSLWAQRTQRMGDSSVGSNNEEESEKTKSISPTRISMRSN